MVNLILNNTFQGLAAFLLSFTLTFLLLPSVHKIALSKGWVDYPEIRKIHIHPIPVIGGIVMLIAFLLCAFIFLRSYNMYGLYAAAVIVGITGFIDDRRRLNHKWKFLGQIIAALCLVYLYKIKLATFGDILSFGHISLGYASVVMTIFCIVGVVNSVNMIDGIDGLAGGITTISLMAFATLAYYNGQQELFIICLLLAGTVLAFLLFNWHPASLFMGDGGSLFLGFMLAFLALATTQPYGSKIPPAAALLILAVPIGDTITIIIKRMLAGKSPFKADKYHLHHILIRFGFNTRSTVIIILTITSVLTSIALFGTFYNVQEKYLFFVFLIYYLSYLTASFRIKKILRIKIRLTNTRGWQYSKKSDLNLKFRESKNHNNGKPRNENPFSCCIEYKKQDSTCSLVDISGGGLCIKSTEHFFDGQKIKVKIKVQGLNSKNGLLLPSEIICTKKENGHYRYGIQFKETDDDKTQRLKEYLSYCHICNDN